MASSPTRSRSASTSLEVPRRSVSAGCPAADCCLDCDLERPAVEVQRALFERRVLTGTATDPQVLRLLPPLSFSLREAALLLAALAEVLA